MKIKNVLCCPNCKSPFISTSEEKDDILACSNLQCKSTFPVISGVPVLLEKLSHNDFLTQRDKQSDSHLREAFTGLLEEKKRIKRSSQILNKFSAFNFPRSSKVIELGSGLGHNVKVLSEHFLESYGLELDFNRILAGHNVDQIVNADMTKIPFVSNYFDIVFCIGVVHHLPDLEHYVLLINEIKRILRADGKLMLWEPKPVFYRGIAEKFVFSPFGNMFNYTKMVKTILLKEWEEYTFWLNHYKQFFRALEDNGFRVTRERKGLFKDYTTLIVCNK